MTLSKVKKKYLKDVALFSIVELYIHNQANYFATILTTI